MRATILSVGTELLFGQIVNTNAAYLSQQLNLLGIDVLYHYTVGDNPERLRTLVTHAFHDCDLILTTGGLGPTQDDLTKEIVCQVMDDRLIRHEPTLEHLEAYFYRLGRTMTENNRKQALVPSRATVFRNDAGTAPGFALEREGKAILCFPGPPRELHRMFEAQGKPYLEKLTEHSIYYRMLRLFGIGESQLETDLLDLIDGQTDPTYATYAKEGECSLRIASKRGDRAEAKAAVEAAIEVVRSRVGRFLYSTEDEELHQVVARKLLERGIRFASAESCTGGLFAQTMTEVPGISAVFDRGYVTYSDRAKIEDLGVDPATIERYGAVSRETALAMADGLRARTGCPLCVAVTGVAGPDGGSEEKPVGLVYISAVLGETRICREEKIRNVSRAWNRNYAKLLLLDTINRLLDGSDPRND